MPVNVYVRFPEAVPRDVDREREAAARAAERHIEEIVAQGTVQMAAFSAEVLSVLGELPRDPDELVSRITTLRERLSVVSERFADDFTRVMNSGQVVGLELGVSIVDRPLLQAVVDFGAAQVQVAELEALLSFAGDRITGLSGDVINRVGVEISRVALGGQSFDDALSGIRQLLPPSGSGSGAATRAESIIRTEVGRVQSFGTQARLEQLTDQVPDLAKEWRHSGRIINARSGHVAATGQRVPVHERFRVAPTVGDRRERLLFPRDPAGSARSVIRCRCTMVPWLRRWEE